jgi:hypothetical protein
MRELEERWRGRVGRTIGKEREEKHPRERTKDIEET